VPVSRDVFRAVSGSFPTGVLIVATVDERGEPKGLTTQAYMGLSTEPPLVIVAIDKTSRTLPALQRSRGFVINFLKKGAEDVATLFASKSDDKFKNVRWEPAKGAGGAPILRDISLAYAACRTTEIHEAGDHILFVASFEGGEVLGGTPLMYYKRTYAPWPEARPAPPVEGKA
jgi:3-hydroxy-9,10-secoandrosta-1,3,5(10)-triene-9,17-dione monooxygenase reductase component